MTPSNHPPNPPNTVGGEPLDAEGRAVQEMLGASRYRIRNVLGRGGMSRCGWPMICRRAAARSR